MPDRMMPAWETLAFVKDIAHGAIINYHDFTQIRLDLSKVFNVGPISECAMLPVIPSYEVLAFDLEPVNNGVGVFLD